MLCLSHIFLCEDLLAGDKPIVGALERVIIEPYGVRVTARIDTGAATSSLDARNLQVSGDKVTFNLSPKFGSSEITVPIVAWRHIRSSGSREKRPIVEMEVCIDSKRLRVWVNLTDRSDMRHAMLIGRNVLNGNFVVDPSQSFIAKPSKRCGKEDK
ncbi:MAG: ATP-dependent zinc protease family protein [Syntrophorhabdaceae bacterium]